MSFADQTVHLCPCCGYPARTRTGLAVHVGRSHRGKYSDRNRELVRKHYVGYPIEQIADLHGLSIDSVKEIVWRALHYPRIYEPYHKLAYSDPVTEVSVQSLQKLHGAETDRVLKLA